jgi:hypothetical protein
MEASPNTIHAFHVLVAAHILTGTTGAIAFWIPVIGRKGGVDHKRWGRLFTRCMLATGALACAMSLLTLAAPMATHPHLAGKLDAAFIQGVFGWMMLYMGILTINLAWYGWQCVLNRRQHEANRRPFNLALQGLVTVAALNCAWQGWRIDMFLMMAFSIVGVATGATNLWFIYKPRRAPHDWQKEHLKGLVGVGISVYTAFLAFGSVRLMPELALNPVMWSVPLAVGLGIILYHWFALDRAARQRQTARASFAD